MIAMNLAILISPFWIMLICMVHRFLFHRYISHDMQSGLPWTRILSFIPERMQGLWYLVRGPSLLQSGYTRVCFHYLQNINVSTLTLLLDSRKLVHASNPIEQSPHGDFGTAHSGGCQCPITRAFTACCRQGGIYIQFFSIPVITFVDPPAKTYNVWL